VDEMIHGLTYARLWHPWHRINRVLRVMLHARMAHGACLPVRKALLDTSTHVCCHTLTRTSGHLPPR
jgi:hypothetical protein